MDRFEHIDLDRTFRKYDVTEQEHDLQILELHDQLGIKDHRQRWRDLESTSRVVVLGEARAGKSEELRQQTRRLRAAGELAFMMTVEDLHDHGLAHAMTDEGVDGMSQWKRQGGVAHLFIDSIDEARLTDRRLETALRRITRALPSDALARARIVMSCRYTDWRRIQDLQTVGELLGGAVEVVVLDRLDWKQIETLVRARAPHSPDGLLERLRTTGAVALAQRPGDLDWLIAYWNEHRRIASLSAVVEDAVERFLREESPRQRQQTLSPKLVRRAVEQLAGVMTLGRWNQLDHPTDGAGVSSIDRLVPASVLSDLLPPQLREVLSSRLFDPATLGRTRFRHRTIREYLAACWLDSLSERGFDAERLEGLFFVVRENQTVARPSIAPVAAWLAPKRERVVRRLLEASPRTLMVDGDPGSLPDALRIGSLVAHADRYADRERLSDSFDGVHLQNFACPALAPTVEELLGRDGPEQLQIMLLRLVRHGQISGCRSAVMRIAVDEARSTHVRGCAIVAIGEVGSRGDRQVLAARYLNVPHIDGILLESLIETIYPDPLDGPAVVSLIRAFVSNRQVSPNGHLWLRFSRMLLRCKEELPWVVEGLRELLERRRADDEEIEPHDDFAYDLYDAALAAMAELWRVGDDLAHLERAIVNAPSAGEAGFRRYGHLERVNEALKLRLELRSALFERLLDCKDEPRRRSALHRVFRPEPHDGPWLVDLTRSSESTQVREAALLILLQHPRVTELDLPELRERVEDAPNLAKQVDERIERRKRAASRAKRKHDEQLEQERRCEEQFIQRLRANLDRLRLGEAQGELVEVYVRAMQVRSSDLDDLDDLEATLIDGFGSEIAAAAMQGFCATWRTCDLERDVAEHHWPIKNVICIGLELDVRDGLDFSTLSDAMAQRATVIALTNRERQPPSWLDGLTRAHPNAVERAIGRLPANDELILRLCHAPYNVRHLCIDRMWAVVESPHRYSVKALRASLGVLLAIDEEHAHLRDICAREYPNEPMFERRGNWWATWFRLDPGSALADLESFEGGDLEELGELTAWAAASMWTGSDSLPHDASILERLWSCFMERIPVVLLDFASRDPRRVSIDTARRRIIEMLGSIDTPGGLEALHRLAEGFTERRDWLLDRIDHRLVEEAEAHPSSMVAKIIDGCKLHGLGFIERAETLLVSEEVLSANPARVENLANMSTHGDGQSSRSSEPDNGVSKKMGNGRSSRGGTLDYLILTALDLEAEAVLGLLELTDERVCVRGTQVEVACLGDIRFGIAVTGPGNQAAATMAAAVVTKQEPIGLVFVGVAGGIKDVSVGDVVVATKIYNYESGKDTVEGFRPRPMITLPDHALLQHARYVRRRKKWLARAGEDREGPNVFIAPIAAGEKVVASKDSEIARHLRASYSDAIAVEMEGMGTLEATHQTNVPGLVVRGISDLLDAKAAADDSGSQPLAAKRAAAFALEVLLDYHATILNDTGSD